MRVSSKSGGREGGVGNIYPAVEHVQIVYLWKTFFFFSISSVLLLFSVCSIDLLPTGIQHLLINLDFVSLSKRNFASNTSNYLNIFHTSILRKQYFIFKISE